MKPIERLNIYLQFKKISPHCFEKKIILSNGYFAKQLRNLGSVGSDILIKIHDHYKDVNILWVLTGEGSMIQEQTDECLMAMQVDEFTAKYETENKKLKTLEVDVEKLNTVLKDKEKIISLYEFMLNNSGRPNTVADFV